MFSRRKIKDIGGTGFVVGDVVSASTLTRENMKAKNDGGEEAKADSLIMSIQEVSLSRESFLSAASFQHTTKILIAAAVRGAQDELLGLKENVIIGRLIPAGTGFKGSPKEEKVKLLQKQLDEIYSYEEEEL
jgi:DNA-directed RNA polymerase subunit beta'